MEKDYKKMYEDALNRAMNLALTNNISALAAGEIFPELKESEDEKIRKELINFFSKGAECDSSTNGIKDRNIIAWLEKQGEQEHIDESKPKFKVRDWITNGEYTWKVIDIKPLDYILQSQNGEVVDDTISYVDEEFHLWTIQDANDGDVLYYKKDDDTEIIVMYSGINIHNNVDSYCRYNSALGFNTYITNVLDAEHDFITPATKEQRDILFQR